MHRIDGIGHSSNLFTGGDKTASPPVLGTRVTPEWLNAVQEEICNLLEYMDFTLAASTETERMQLLDAVGNSRVAFSTAAAGGAVTELEAKNASVSRDSDGVYTITWDNDFDNVNYTVQATVGWTGSGTTEVHAIVTDIAVGSCKVRIFDSSWSAYQANTMRVSVIAFGTWDKP